MFQLSLCYSVFMTKEARPVSYNFTIYCDKYEHLFKTTHQNTIHSILRISRHLEDRQGVKESEARLCQGWCMKGCVCPIGNLGLCSEQRRAPKYFKGKSHF